MSIKLIITRGFGNGTFLGAIKDIVLRGYKSDVALTAGLAAAGSTHIFMAENVMAMFPAEKTTEIFGPENVMAMFPAEKTTEIFGPENVTARVEPE